MKYIGIICLIIGNIWAQEPIVILSPKVGTVIDIDENEFYSIFPHIRGFVSAQIYMGDGRVYEARIEQQKRGKTFTTSKFIPMETFASMQVAVNGQPRLTEDRRKLLHENLFYLRVPDILTNIEKPQFIKLKVVGDRKIKGTLLSFENDSIQVQTVSKLEKFDIHELESISYRLSMRDVLVLKPIIRTVSAIIGLGIGEFWNEQRQPKIDLRWYYRFLGITVGLLSSGEIYEAIETLVSPTKTFALTESEFKKD